jgi:hypothetical protein
MAKIKESHLRKIFESYGLDEGIFDFFKKIKIGRLEREIEDLINSRPTKEEREKLRNLSKAISDAASVGLFDQK